jgi:hypothetical protein
MPSPHPIYRSALLLALLTVSAACRDGHPVGLPAQPGGARIETLSAEGCTGFTINTADRANVTVTESIDPACGGVRPVVAGQPAFDVQNLVLRIPVAIRNGLADPLEDPARVWSREDLLKVLQTDAVIAGTETPLVFANADSTGTDLSTGTARILSAWRYDARLPQRNGTAFLEPDSSSAAGWIEVAVHPAVTSFQVVFHAKAGIPPVYVPETIPDTVPEALYAADHVESASPLMSGTFLRNVVVVMFREDATQAQKETAVRLVQGEVVGGWRYFEGDGKYYVRIPDDGTAAPLLAALDRLEAMPQVEGAGPEFIFGLDEMLSYMRPQDGAGWTQWELAPNRAGGQNWALEAIGAPMAWGCSMGSTGVRVAVVDHGFQAPTDVAQNTAVRYYPYAWPDSVSHGTSVASVLAARGNNGVGITGAAWYASLELWGLGLNWAGVPTKSPNGRYSIRNGVDLLAQAVRRGAPVVNMSIGMKWAQPPGTRADSVRVRRFYRNLSATLHRALGRRATSGVGPPLLVFAAGNNNADAYWAGYPNLVNEFPDWVLAVGSADAGSGGAMTKRATSNWGSLVQLYAPGGGVGALNATGNPIAISGTSFAAPLVSGVAGLLFAFDPRLTAREVKTLLLEGAAAGGRVIPNGSGTAPVLNAYEALKAAGGRTGAPLCGNRVWAQGTSLYAERKGGAAEALGPAQLTDAALEVEPLHGGQYVQFRSGGSVGAIRWSREGWFHSLPPNNATALRSGTLSSLMGFSHARDTLVYANTSTVSGTDWWRQTPQIDVQLFRRTTAGDAQFTTITVQKLPLPEQSICVEQTKEEPKYCTLTYSMMRWWMFRVGYPQNDQPALVAVSPMYGRLLDSTAWHPCLDDGDYECREVKTEQKQMGTRVYTVPWAGGSPTEIAHIQDERSIFWLGHSESDSTLVSGRGAWWITKWFSPTSWRYNGDGEYDIQGEVIDCAIEYRRLAGFPQLRAVGSDNTCNWNHWDRPTYAGGGGISPSRAPAPAGGTGRSAVVHQAPSIITPEGVVRAR